MGIQLEISLDKDIRELDQFFDDLKFKAVTQAARMGLNRAARDIKALSNKEIRKRRKMKLSEVKKRISIKTARGRNIADLEASVNFSGFPLPLILFIIGKKTPKVQTQANPKRKSRQFEIVKGQKKAKKGLFVQKAQRGKLRHAVYRRRDAKDVSQGFAAQSAPSIANLLRSKRNLLRKIENSGIAIMQREYDRVLKLQLLKLKL